jgi:hypothetical protein
MMIQHDDILDGASPTQQSRPATSRRRFLAQASLGLGAAAALLATTRSAEARGGGHDTAIVQAAATAEALATTMYYNIITSSIYADGLNSNPNDQAYLVAGHQQELNHYNLLTSIAPALATTFYFPTGMFGSASTYATTVNTLVTLEDAFIAAYLIGVRDLSSAALRVLAAQIMGVEAEHRTFGRVIAADLNLHSTTGLTGKAEGVDGTAGFAANNLAYERTFQPPLYQISDVVNALGPFIGVATAGFSKTPYHFADSTVLPSFIMPITLTATAP